MGRVAQHTIALLVVVIGWAFSAQLLAQSDQGAISLAISVEPRQEGREHLAHITLRNTGSDVVNLLQDNLPWGPSLAGMQIQAWRAIPPYAPLKKINLFAHSDKLVEIRPGEALSGVVRLSRRFPELDDVLREAEVMFFWGYRALPLGPDLKAGNPHQSLPLTGSFVIRNPSDSDPKR
jgi:hypothetical protein